SSGSSRTCAESYSTRPVRSLLPSSTDPAVATRSSVAGWAGAGASGPWPLPLEVATPLAVLHGGLGHSVVGARLAALCHARGGDLGHHLLERCRARLDAARAGHVADRAVADVGLERLLPVDQLDVGAERVEHPVAAEHLAAVGEVDRRHL